MIKKVIVTLAGCAFIASLAVAQPQKGQSTAEQVTVTGTLITTIEEGSAANYQPPKTLVVRQDRSNKPGTYALNGTGHVVDKRGALIQTAIQPGARVQVYYTSAGDSRVVDHVVVLD